MIQSIPQLERCRDDWQTLAAARRSPLLDHDWFLSCAEAFHAGSDLRILTVGQTGGGLAGIAPLVHERLPAGARVTHLGVSRLYEPCDWLCASPDAASALVDQGLALGRPLVLQRLPERSLVIDALRTRPWHQAMTVARATATALAVPTTGRWDVYYDSLSSHITSNLQRLRRKAERALGPMTVERVVPAPHQVDTLLESFIAIEGSGWKGRRGSDLGNRIDLRRFFRGYGHRAAAAGRLHVAWLSFGDHPAAAELSIDAYDRIWQLKIGYHEALKADHPGLQLTGSSIEWAFEQGREAYEFLGSAASWEERWRPEERRFQTVAAYPLTAPGLAGACRDAIGMIWRRLPLPQGVS